MAFFSEVQNIFIIFDWIHKINQTGNNQTGNNEINK